MLKSNDTHGFTLVELAIVITIIGILIGGVLKGQQLIDNARVAATISQVQGYKTALPIFYSTYDALPGDMADAEKRIINCSGCAATDFDNGARLDDNYIGYNGAFKEIRPGENQLQNTLSSEPTRFWLHLYKANLISGISDIALSSTGQLGFSETHPSAKIGGGYHVGQSVNSGNAHMWGAYSQQPSGLVLLLHGDFINGREGVMSPQKAAAIDRKMDDGNPDSGSVWGGGGNCTENNFPDTIYEETRDDALACAQGFIMDY